jgi:hypothetical protein
MIIDKIRIYILKTKIKRHPFIGIKDSEGGLYIYRQGKYIAEYEILNAHNKKPAVKIISMKHKLTEAEIEIRNAKRLLRNIFFYQGWVNFFKPRIIIPFILGTAVIYFGAIESHQNKVDRYRWIVASVIGVSSQEIQYIGDGWLEMSTHRETDVDRVSEPITYRFNPFRWLFYADAGIIDRWIESSRQYATHPVVYNGEGDVWLRLNKERSWQHGKIAGRTVEWDVPQGTGIRAGKVTGHGISVQDKKLYIKDK